MFNTNNFWFIILMFFWYLLVYYVWIHRLWIGDTNDIGQNSDVTVWIYCIVFYLNYQMLVQYLHFEVSDLSTPSFDRLL